jgi:gliding motility-associated-like protein
MKNIYYWISVLLILLGASVSSAQICDPTVPVFTIDLTGNPNGVWTSPFIGRNGQCCSASGANVCVEFVITLDSAANGISFDIVAGAVPGGALFYQVNCGAPSPLGSPVCLSGPGPHYITFCKPGNNTNVYQITSIPEPSAGGTEYVSQACTGYLAAHGLDVPTITYTSIPFNALYNSYLSCTSGCDSSIVTPIGAAPPFVDYQVCGNVAGACGVVSFCDTIRINFVNTLAVNITPQNPTICFGGSNAVVTANPGGGLAPYSYLWSTGATTQSISVGAGTYSVQLTDAMNCSVQYDTVTVNAFSLPIAANAGPDQLLCNGSATSLVLNGSITAASGGQWYNGTGTFFPNNATLNAVYSPSASEITAGAATLMLVTTGNQGCPADTDYFTLTIAPQPSPVVSGATNVCQFSAQMYTATNPNPVTYTWTATGGTITNNFGDSIAVSWNTLGAGNVTVTATNAAGCDTTIQLPVAVQPQPAPVMSGTSFACTPSTTVYHVTNSMNDNVAWIVTGGTIIGSSSADSVVVQWTTSGSGTVTSTETNALGCDSTVSMMITLSSTPVTSIAGPPNMCGAIQATYTAATSNAVTHSWTVNGGTIINNNGSSINVQWTNIGTNTITLTATNAQGSDTTLMYTVDVYPQPTPAITGVTQVCTPASTVYQIVNPIGNTYNWTVLGGTITGSSTGNSVSVFWGAAGSGLVSVTETNSFGCDSVIAMLVDLSATPVTSISGLQNMCGALQTTYSAAASNAVTHSWTVNGGTILNNNGLSIDVQWTNIGTNTITLTATNPDGCDTTLTYTVDVYPQPTPAITGVTQVCTPASTVYQIVNPIGNTYNWTVLGGTITGSSTGNTVSVFWGAAGSGLVSVTETNSFGCDSVIAMLVDLSATPVTSISGLQNMCGALQTTYSAAASNAVTHSWTVNGGTIINNYGSSINVRWTNIGTNTITLTATNPDGCDTTLTYTVDVYPQPTPSISGASLVCTPSVSVYHAVNPTSNSYSWSVIGGTITGSNTSDSVIITWNSPGAGLISLTETNSFGCDSIIAKMVNLSATPVTSIAGTQNVCGQTTMIYSAAPSNATSFNWTVNGGTIINTNGDNITVSWTGSGAGSVTLTATNAQGCDTTITYPVNLYPQPAPVLNGPITLCLPAQSTYRVSSQGGNNYTWMVTEGTILGSIYGDSVQVQWNNTTGTGTITVTAANAYGCDSTVSLIVNRSLTPTPFITGPQSFCGVSAALYSSSASNASVYNWNVNGGNIVTNSGDSILVNWNTVGTKTITLTAINPEGCDTTLYYTANVYPQPSPTMLGDPAACTPSTHAYSLASATGVTYNWTVNGGSITGPSNGSSVMVMWNSVGAGSISVTETNSYGCDTTVQMSVNMTPYPMPDITGNDFVCQKDTQTYTAQAIQGHTYNWSVIGGSIISFTVSNSIDVYWYNPGAGKVSLNQVSQEGCGALDSEQVLVNLPPSPAITGLPTACLNDEINYFTNQNAGSTYSWQMNGGNFNGSSMQSSTTVDWTIAGYGSLIVTETDVNGCTASVPLEVFVNPLPSANILGSQVGCSDSWGSTYTTLAQNNVVYQWSANGGSVSGSNIQDHVNILWNNTGIALVNLLTLNTSTGCRSTTSLQVLIDSMPQMHVTANNFAGCAPVNAVLGSSPQSPAYNYQWALGDGGFSGDATVAHTYTQPGNYNVTLIAYNNSGCRDTVHAIVVVYNSPIADFDLNVSDDFYPADESVFSLQNNSTGGAQYFWSFGDGYTTTEYQPSYHYDGAGSYEVMLITTNVFGCRDSMRQAIEIRVPESIYIPNAFTPNGDSNNDGFSVYMQNITELKVSIFDRWGEEVFTSNDKNFVWDGTYIGHKVQEGVYVYKIAAKGFHGQHFDRVGTVSVVK